MLDHRRENVPSCHHCRVQEGATGVSGNTIASVVIPAHNEAATVGRLLNALTQDATDALDITVVCNGCTDDTATKAQDVGANIRVVETATASKRAAQTLGDTLTTVFPRLYVDADVVIGAADVRRLLAPLVAGDALATAPRRRIDLTNASLLVRAYYSVWERLPQVQTGLFGRGVIALSREGYERVRCLPTALSDDLIMSEAFAPEERSVISAAEVVIQPPRTARDLVLRRERVATGNVQADRLGLRAPASRTSMRDLARLVREEPRLSGPVLAFLAVGAAARIRSARSVRSGDFTSWRRDDSSRQIG